MHIPKLSGSEDKKMPTTAKEGLSKKERRRLEEAKNLTRRAMLKWSLASAALAAAGTGAYLLHTSGEENNETVSSQEAVMRAVEALRKSNLADVQWHHPEGGNEAHPIKPLLLVGFPHPSGLGEQDPYILHTFFKILLTMEEAGIRAFAVEGWGKDQNIPRFTVDDANGLPLTPAQNRQILSNPRYFQKMLEQNQNVILWYAACAEADVMIRGAEDPARVAGYTQKYQEEIVPLEKALQPLLQAAWTTANPGDEITIQTSVDEEGNLVVNGKTFDGERSLVLMEKFLTFPRDPMHKAREKYIADSLPDAQAVLFGTNHIESLRTLIPAHGRSLAVVCMKDDVQTENVQDALAIRVVELLIRTLKKNRHKQLVKE